MSTPASAPLGHIDPARSACLLIGVDAYESLERLRSVEHNLTELTRALRDENIGAFGGNRVTALPNPASALAVTEAIGEAGALAEDTLLVYYAGHGLVGRDGELYLTLPTSLPGRHESWVDARDVRAAVERAGAQRSVVILDCCFSGRYIPQGVMSAGAVETAVQSLTEDSKSFTLTSAPRDRVGHAPDPDRCSVFTGALVKVLKEGKPDGPPMLTLDMVYERLRTVMKGVPEAQRPQCHDDNNLGGLGFVRNAALRLPPWAPSGPPPAPRRRWPAALLGAAVGAALAVGGPALWPHLHHAPSTGDCSPDAALLGYSDALDKVRKANDRVSGLSGLAFDPQRSDRVYAVSDNATGLIVPVRIGAPGHLDPVAGEPWTLRGADDKPIGAWLDAEALVMEKGGGTVLVASEDGPGIRRFDLGTRRQTASFKVPPGLHVAPAGTALAGRSFESLAASPKGDHLYAGMEAPLAQDGDWHGQGLIRIQRYTGAPGKTYRPDRQYEFVADEGMYLVELAALDDHRLLALERQYTVGLGNAIRVRQIDLSEAPDVSREPSLFSQPSDLQAPSVPVFDLADCPSGDPGSVRSTGPQANPLLENVEGMALGPTLDSGPYRGRRLLLMISDDNDSASQITRLYALAVKPAGG
ncbi:esterase-like activity of phytase family protein [Streptomyces sp. TS71-3]|uniref:caspase, EACC1-associated type n=1 Tax=Streptomyces sp. TS71-3 TaxID=2733862 RepID=UPI001B17AEA1|nr:esterase-like activity of phytase family protein [Streptomyces sp. TS71-3]GHJ36744.1 hypothetical protein Sm713_23530 [Streptomyces sp. TS71-3]